MYNHWEIHEVDGNIVFVEIGCYSSRCLFMDDLCERVVGVEVVKNLAQYLPDTEMIEMKGDEVYETLS